MRDFFLALFLVGCTPQAGSDCPAVVSVGQPCSVEGVACLYASTVSGPCMPIPEYKCESGRWKQVTQMLPAYCNGEGGAEAGGDARSDAGSDASDAMNSSDG